MTTALGREIINVASSYVVPENICYEVTRNRGWCIDELKCYYKGLYDRCATTDIGSEAYCALSVWVWIDKACKNLGAENILPKTKGALDLLNKSKKHKDIEVDKNVSEGSVFYRKSSASGASGHVGVVVKLDEDVFHTVEANMTFVYKNKKYEGVWTRYYPYSDIDKRNFHFIHTEKFKVGNNLQVASIGSEGSILPFLLIGTGIFWIGSKIIK